jgi:4'-phosphopantetheinyl transferase
MATYDLQIFTCDTSAIPPAAVSELLPLLSSDERDRFDWFGFAEDRRDYAASHALLRIALSAKTNLAPERFRFGATPWGKPFLVSSYGRDPSPSFSLAHARGLVACVIGDGPLGIDVEAVDPAVDAVQLAERFFSTAEAASLRECSADVRAGRFCELWTLKEALGKALGFGLGVSMRSPSFTIDADGVHTDGAQGWSFYLEDVGGRHKLAVASRDGGAIQRRVIDANGLAEGRMLDGFGASPLLH